MFILLIIEKSTNKLCYRSVIFWCYCRQ